MAKLACKSCGGKVMAKGGATPKKILPKAKMGLNYGIPQEGTTNYSAPTMKKGGRVGAVKKMKLGGDPGDPKPNSVLKNLGIASVAGGLIGLLTTERGQARRAERKEDKLIKKGKLEKLKSIRDTYDNKGNKISKFGGGVKKK
jgi:hypothetical protein